MNTYFVNFISRSYDSYKWNFTETPNLAFLDRNKKNKDSFKNRKDESKNTFADHFTRLARKRERENANNTQEAAHASYRGNRSWLINLLRGHKFDAVNSDRFLYTWHLKKDVYEIYAFSSVHLFHALTHPTLKSVPRSRTPCLAPYVTPIR